MARATFQMRLSGGSTLLDLYVNYAETYDIATNKSSVKINSLEVHSTAEYNFTAKLYGRISINGTEVFKSDISVKKNTETAISATAATIAHNTDGTGNFTLSFEPYERNWGDFYANMDGGGKYYITETSRSISLTSHTRQWKLTVSAGTGSTITVKRGSTTLSNGATITYGDSLAVTASAKTGYKLTTNPTGTITVTGAVTVKSAAEVLSYKLTMSVGVHTTMTVNRTSSPLKGASTGQLNSGSTIYYNDVLTVNCSATTGFHLTANPAGTKTVTGNVSVTSAADVDEYALTITKDSHVTVTVNRTSSPNKSAATGNLATGAKIYYGDVLKTTYSADAGYKVKTATRNGSNISSGSSASTTGDVKLVFATDVLAVVRICRNGSFKMHLVEIVKGGQFKLHQPYIYKNGSWKPYM